MSMKGSVPSALPREGIINYPKSIYLWRKPQPSGILGHCKTGLRAPVATLRDDESSRHNAPWGTRGARDSRRVAS